MTTEDKVVTYKTDAEQPIVKPPSPWPYRLSRVQGPVVRLSAVVAIALGPIASGSLVYVAWFLLMPVALVHVLGALFVIMNKGAPLSQTGWLATRSWAQTLLIAAWAPIAIPLLVVYRLAKWIGTGE